DAVDEHIARLTILDEMGLAELFERHPRLLQHAGRRRVSREAHRLDTPQAKRPEAIFDHRSRRLGGVATVPVIMTDPVSDVSRRRIREQRHADGTDERFTMEGDRPLVLDTLFFPGPFSPNP